MVARDEPSCQWKRRWVEIGRAPSLICMDGQNNIPMCGLTSIPNAVAENPGARHPVEWLWWPIIILINVPFSWCKTWIQLVGRRWNCVQSLIKKKSVKLNPLLSITGVPSRTDCFHTSVVASLATWELCFVRCMWALLFDTQDLTWWSPPCLNRKLLLKMSQQKTSPKSHCSFCTLQKFSGTESSSKI